MIYSAAVPAPLRTPASPIAAALFALIASSACATTGAATKTATTSSEPPPAVVEVPPAQQEVKMSPLMIKPGGDALTGLEAYDAETLFKLGKEAFGQEDYKRASLIFDKIAQDFPDTRHIAPTLYNAGLSHELTGDLHAALDRYQYVIDSLPDARQYTDAMFRAGDCLLRLSRYKEVVDVHYTVLERDDLTATDRIEALAKMGLGWYQREEPEMARDSFIRSLSTWRRERRHERIDNDFYIAQSQYYLAELARDLYRAIKIVVPQEDAQVEAAAEALEQKCKHLLDAQRDYIKTIRVGNPRWATAAGYRIGSLYEELYDVMIGAEIPDGLEQDAGKIYLETLKKRVEVLVTKAIRIYERSLRMAQRVGEENEWVKRTEQSLERLKQLYLKEYSS